MREPRALRATFNRTGQHHKAPVRGALRLHRLDQHGPAAELPGHLTALRPSPDASNRRHHVESAHSLKTVCGRRLCSMGENGEYPLLTPASLHNGCEQTKPVSGLPLKVRPTWACRKTARFSSLPADPGFAQARKGLGYFFSN